MSYQEAYQEPYTKYPNRYNDVIKPNLTDTQRDVCDLVIRLTWGWHKNSALISNSLFIEKTNKSKQGIIKAKKQLEDLGLLIVVKKGRGSKPNEYRLDLDYDDPEKSIKASRIRQEERSQKMVAVSKELELALAVPEETESIPEHLEIPTPHESDISQETQQVEIEVPAYDDTSESQPAEPEVSSEHDEMEIPTHEEETVESDSVEPDEDCVPAAEIPDSNTPSSHAEISHTPEPKNPVIAEDSESPTSQLSLPPYKEYSNIPGIERKQTESDEEKKDRKKAAATVCSLLRSWGIELEARDYAFVGWCFKTYGVEIVNEKIQIMKFQRSRSVSFSTPLGWLRKALSGNYQHSRWDSDVAKAKERARRQAERSRIEQIQRERENLEIEKLRDEAKKMKAQLAPEDREDLRKAAIKQLLGMDGITENWLNKCTIGSVENQILRERMVM